MDPLVLGLAAAGIAYLATRKGGTREFDARVEAERAAGKDVTVESVGGVNTATISDPNEGGQVIGVGQAPGSFLATVEETPDAAIEPDEGLQFQPEPTGDPGTGTEAGTTPQPIQKPLAEPSFATRASKFGFGESATLQNPFGGATTKQVDDDLRNLGGFTSPFNQQFIL